MDKETASAPEFDAQPPPYSAVATPHLIMPEQPVSIPLRVQHPHYHSQHHGYGPETVIQTPIVTHHPGIYMGIRTPVHGLQTVATTHVVINSPLFGPEPRTMICTACNQTVTSKVTQNHSKGVHICAICLCLFGCWPCVLCIYCRKCSLRSNHYCSNCDAYQGTYIPDY